MKAHILIVDDEETLRHFLKLTLQDEGYKVTTATDGREALRLVEQQEFDLALVDLRMEEVGGLEVMRHIKQVSPSTGVIILTAYASVPSAVEALRHGAYDYLIKPFGTEEMLASVADGIARKAVPPPTEQIERRTLEAGDMVLDLARRQVTRGGRPLDLTPTEFDLLKCLMLQPNVALDSQYIIKQVRGYEAIETDARAIVRVHVYRLRQKLEDDPTNPVYVLTVAGGRYVFVPPSGEGKTDRTPPKEEKRA